jgi:hypothetical protein
MSLEHPIPVSNWHSQICLVNWQPQSPHGFPVQPAEQGFAHVPLARQIRLESQQTPLQQLFEQQLLLVVQEFPADVQTHVPLEQKPEQQSLPVSQPESPLGMQLTQVMVVLSQLLEQQSASLVHEPLFAIQQVPLLQV